MEFPRNVALTLARPLLWAAFEPSLLGFLPGKLTQRIQMAYALVRNLQPARYKSCGETATCCEWCRGGTLH